MGIIANAARRDRWLRIGFGLRRLGAGFLRRGKEVLGCFGCFGRNEAHAATARFMDHRATLE